MLTKPPCLWCKQWHTSLECHNKVHLLSNTARENILKVWGARRIEFKKKPIRDEDTAELNPDESGGTNWH